MFLPVHPFTMSISRSVVHGASYIAMANVFRTENGSVRAAIRVRMLACCQDQHGSMAAKSGDSGPAGANTNMHAITCMHSDLSFDMAEYYSCAGSKMFGGICGLNDARRTGVPARKTGTNPDTVVSCHACTRGGILGKIPPHVTFVTESDRLVTAWGDTRKMYENRRGTLRAFQTERTHNAT